MTDIKKKTLSKVVDMTDYTHVGIPNIFQAAASNDVRALKVALKHYDINSTDEIGMTPLHYAASTLSHKTVDYLLNAECDATLADKFERTAATLAYECLENLSTDMVNKLKPHCFPWLYEQDSSPENT